ncbi:MAG: hypothetical protein HY318_17825, partial [Armatimonadetes bacterium]|nr:hypothetical protein [Armatimonadota bacterium]
MMKPPGVVLLQRQGTYADHERKEEVMSFHDEQFEFEYELDTYYSTYPTDLSQIETELHRLSSHHPE